MLGLFKSFGFRVQSSGLRLEGSGFRVQKSVISVLRV